MLLVPAYLLVHVLRPRRHIAGYMMFSSTPGRNCAPQLPAERVRARWSRCKCTERRHGLRDAQLLTDVVDGGDRNDRSDLTD